MKKKVYSILFSCFLFLTGFHAAYGANVTLTTTAVAADTIYQGTSSNIVYIVKMDVSTTTVTVNNIQYTVSGTHDADDFTATTVYFNTSPNLTGATYLGQTTAAFAAPHTYSIGVNKQMTAGTSGYFIIMFNTSNTATDNNTIQINGQTNPVIFSFTSATTLTNSQTNAAGVQTIQAADIALSTSAVAADTIYQGSNSNIVYIVKMKNTKMSSVVVNNIQYTLSGTNDADDFTATAVYFNTVPSLSGASYLTQSTANFASPHTYSLGMYKLMNRGDSGYFIITINVSNTATDNNTMQLNGKTNPVVFSYGTAPNVTSNQTNIAGVQTIQAADITLSTSAVAADTIYQGSNSNIVYIVKMKNSKMSSVVVNNIQYTVSGTHDADDFTYTTVYFNTVPSLTGASYLSQANANFAAPHTYSLSMYKLMNRGDSGYFIITINVNNTATDNNTIQLNGKTNPVVFSYGTAPNVTSNQTNIAGLQTIQAADITINTTAVAADTIYQGSNSNIVYIVKMKNSKMSSVIVNTIQYSVDGTHDADDFTYTTVYFNTVPSLTGASYLSQANANFAAPHTYSLSMYKLMNRGDSGYFIITVNVSNTATDNHTIQLNGKTNPVVFSYGTAPNVTSNQTNIAGLQTIQAADITINTTAVAADTIYQGSNSNIFYIMKMKNSKMSSVIVNNIQYTVNGTHDADDFTYTTVYFNTVPSLTGASYLSQANANFAAPHTYSLSLYKLMNRGDSGYFIITVNVSNTATDNHTIQLNGKTNPVVFSYGTAPNITSNQTNIAGVQTIQAAEVALSSSSVAAGNIARNSNSNIIYIVKADVSAMDNVIVNNIQYTFTGTHDADDLTYTTVYFNTAPNLTGASYLGQLTATFAAPHTYSMNIYKLLSRGTSGYFIITVNVNAAGTLGHTVQVNGATNPVLFSYTTAPNSTNNQTNVAGVKTISATMPFANTTGTETTNASAKAKPISVNVYPNPASDWLKINFRTDISQAISMRLSNDAGTVIKTENINTIIGNNDITVDTRSIAAGTYYITLNTKDELLLTEKVIIRH